MRTSDPVRMLVGGVVVYVVMAACASSEPAGRLASSGDGGSSAGGAEGAGGADQPGGGAPEAGSSREAGSLLDALAPIADALTNPVPDAKAQMMSGTRIKAKYLITADGAKQWQGWYDSMRKEDCTFVAATDGTTRCMPTASVYSVGIFSDPGCATPIAAANKGPNCLPVPLTYAGVYDPTLCPAGYRLYAVGAPFAGTDYYSGAPGSCTKVSTSAVPMLDFYEVGAAVVPTDFVQATVSTE